MSIFATLVFAPCSSMIGNEVGANLIFLVTADLVHHVKLVDGPCRFQ